LFENACSISVAGDNLADLDVRGRLVLRPRRENVDFIFLDDERAQWFALLKTIMNYSLP
jgi:hypothetical protein